MNLSFHTMIMLAYTIPSIYVFISIWNHFIDKHKKLHYVLIYTLIAAVYPLSGWLDGRTQEILQAVSDYLLPFYLYLFLFILLYDLFLLLNLLIKIIPPERRRTPEYRKYCLSTVIILSVIVVVGGVINFNTVRTTEYKIEVPGRASDISHLRIAFAADFHIDRNTPVAFIRRFADKVESSNPDIMLYGGDIVEGRYGENMDEQVKILRDIRTGYGVYGVLGNHEYYRGQDRGDFFEKAGITLLRDTVVTFGSSFSLGGRLDSHYRNRLSADDLVDAAPDSLPLILIDHRPTELGIVSQTRTDVQLSGHTHDGQMFPINLITKKVYVLSKGYMKIGNTHFFVTSGIRQWRFPVRTTGKSEIMIIDVDFK